MKYHILNGDALAEKFPPLERQVIVMREAFMDGPVSETFDAAYWAERIAFVADTFDADAAEYWTQFGSQLVLLRQITDADEVYLWFEHDLFCIVNMMVAAHYIWLHANPVLYRVYPSTDKEKWAGFGYDDKTSLTALFEKRIQLNVADITFMKAWWKAYVHSDVEALQQLSRSTTNAMHFADEVTQAHVERLHNDENERQPGKMLREMNKDGSKSFGEFFAEFSKKAGVYGLGDTQVKRLLGAN